jgi:predicted nucleic acid-binding protein
MDIFLDTNVLIDVLENRQPYYAASAAIWTLCEQGKHQGNVSVISFNNIYHIVRKLSSKSAAQKAMTAMRDIFSPVALDAQLLNQAIGAGFGDFEDAIQYHSAVRAGAKYFLTRNVNHFPKSPLPIITPAEFLAAHPTR